MGASYSLLLDRGESLRRPLWLSIGFHIAIAAVAFVCGFLGPRGTRLDWGENGTGGSGEDATKVNAVTSLPGIPLPTPTMTTRNAIANESPGLHQDEPQPKPQEEEKADEIPKFKDAIPPKRPLNIAKHLNKDQPPPPENAIPYGMGGAPDQNFSQFQMAGGGSGGGLGFGDADFGSRYGWYVQALRNRISMNWLMSTVSPSLTSAPRLFIAFDIMRDGTIAHVQLIQSSGIPEVDRSAQRAVLASNPVNPLPRDYSGNMISVKFYFDFRRSQ